MNEPAVSPAENELVARLRQEAEAHRIARLHAEHQAELAMKMLHRRQTELGLLAAVARAANESDDFESAFATALAAICEFGAWDLAHVLLRPRAGAPLRSARVWHCEARARFQSFISASEQLAFEPGEDLPGEAIARLRPLGRLWPQATDQSRRAQCARECGLVWGYAFPISAGRHGDAVVEIYSTRHRQLSELLFELVPQIAAQLGRTLERYGAGEELKHSQAELEAKVKERTETLASTVVQLNTQMSEQRRIQRELALHDRAISAAANGIVLVDALNPDLPIVYCNPAFTRLTGYESAEVVGRSYAFLRPADESEDARQDKETFERVILAGKRSQIVIQTTRKDGTWFWNQLTISPVRDEFGMLTHFVGIIEDVTEQRHTAEVLQRAKDTTDAANRELSRAARLKDEFLASMSHELRTPLNAILGLAQAMQENVYGALTDEQHTVTQTIVESGSHLLELINDILDISKIESGKMLLHFDEVDPCLLSEASLRFIKGAAAKKRLHVTADVPADLPLFHADQRRLKQILVNLLTNAVKFTPEDGHVGLEVRADAAAGTMSFSVWDDGIGISPADQERLFQTFVQVDSKLSRQFGGTGLGLALVRGMARLHGGDVSLHSAAGQGSRFTVTLPLHPPKLAAETARTARPQASATPFLSASSAANSFPPVPTAAGQGRRLLLAEDNEMNRRTVCDYLTACGYEVAIACNGLEAVALTAEQHPDLVLMDVQMPKLDGLEATRRIRANPDTARTPIVALTALAMVGDDVRCLSAGVDKYLSKPVNLRELNSTIQEMLAHPHRSGSRN